MIAVWWRRFVALVWRAITICGLGIGFIGLLSLGWECLTWLRTEVWESWDFWLAWDFVGLGHVSTDWLGVNEFIEWLMIWPLWFGLVVSGLVMWMIGMWSAIKAEARTNPPRKAKASRSRI